ncbi:MAG: amidase [Pseudomonadota bacterium]
MTNRRRLLTRTLSAAGLAALASPVGRSAAPPAGQSDLPADITRWTALELSSAIHSRVLSCREVLDACWQRLEALNAQFNAVVSVAPYERLAVLADERDAELKRGNSRGWLHGMPTAPKDLADARGFVTSSGSPLFAQQVAATDDVHIARMRAAGALFLGKTNVPEFGLGSQTYNTVFGATGNAFNPALTAGGSSGGAAVALALGLVPVADGSDFMGSLRNPAAFNNVIGFRPTPGLVPSSERFVEELPCNGPMARTVSDAARLLVTLAGHDPVSPTSLPVNPKAFLAPLQRSWKGARIGWLGDFDGYLAMEPGLLAHCERALPAFARLGCVVDAAKADYSPAELWQVWLTFRHWLTRSWGLPLYEDEAQRALLKPELRWEIEGGAGLTADDISHASVRRAAWYHALRQLFESYDFLALPTTQVYPFSKTVPWPKSIDGRTMDTYHRWMEVVVPGTLSGCPVLNLSVGIDDQGLPAGIQLIAPRYADFDLLAMGYAYEQATRWNPDLRSPLLSEE